MSNSRINNELSKPQANQDKKFNNTDRQYETSVVKVFTTYGEANYDEPWSGLQIGGCTGSGFVIKHGCKKYVMTNAHVVENQKIVRVRLGNDHKKYKASVKCVSYQSDLALLEVSDPEFNNIAMPVELGDMVSLQQELKIVGFPTGGDHRSITKGIVSRIEVGNYSMSGLSMLQVQTDAAINPGNSGGPAFLGDKVIGVAFQKRMFGEGLGYLIPIPVMKHFLTEVFSNKPYRGFPIIPIVTQLLKNPAQREYYGLQDEETGIRISKIDLLSDAYKKLKSDDIILEIDSYKVSNNGMVDIPGIGNGIDLCHLTQMKYIGDTVTLKILRKNADTKKIEKLNVTVTLDTIPHETEKVPETEHDKLPTYYIASGVVFSPVTRNYLEGNGCEIGDYYDMEQGCFIADLCKKTPDEQLVVISRVFDCDANVGYGSYENAFVKEVNGQPINNLQDLIKAIESNTGPLHRITTASKEVMVIKNMSKEEHEQILNLYGIDRDRSKDLQLKKADEKTITGPVVVPSVKKEAAPCDEKNENEDEDNSVQVNSDNEGNRLAALTSDSSDDETDDEDANEEDDQMEVESADESESSEESQEFEEPQKQQKQQSQQRPQRSQKSGTNVSDFTSHSRFFNKRKHDEVEGDEVEEPSRKKRRLR